MIPSAVVIPGQESSHATNGDENGASSSPSTLKRKLSHSTSNDRKRPRVDTNSDSLNYDDATKSTSPEDTRPKSTTQNSPPRRRQAPAVEEKKRTQRLFGSLLGTLSQSGAKSNPAHKKRDEIEARQRERLKREHEEQESARKRKKDDIAKRRRKEQRLWDEESEKLKHANMRAMGGFLRTKTEPVLYYLPWELRQDEETLIQRQKTEAESLIRQNLEETQPKPKGETSPIQVNGESSLDEKRDQQATVETVDLTPLSNGSSVHGSHHEAQQMPDQGSNDPGIADTDVAQPGPLEGDPGVREDHAQDAEQKDDDPHGDELVEGQEDDVIY